MPWFFFRRRRTATPTTDDQGPLPPYFYAYRRRYRTDAPYILPTDLDEANRLDFQHFMVRSVMRGLYWAPILHPMSILDVGAGTGRWAREVAQIFPDANVIGLDLKGAPVNATGQPDPDNVTFVQGNLLEGLPFADGLFDLVHQRFLISGIPQQKWPQAVTELARVTAPNGWVELVEAGLSDNNGPALRQLDTWVEEILARRDLDIRTGNRIGSFLQQAGLQQVTQRAVTLPLGAYGGRLGVLAEKDYFAAILAMRDLIASVGITDIATYDALVAQARQELQQGQVVWPVYVAYGQCLR
jgi:ubiquinone/menaquinone biosynthesis C-methylase UbiE